jgi:hypothetical protein
MAARYDAEVIRCEDPNGGEDKHFLTRTELNQLVDGLKDGDDLVVHRIEDSDDEALYPPIDDGWAGIRGTGE